MTWHCRGKVILPLSGVLISNGHYNRMSQQRTMVLSKCVKWSMTCIITIIRTSLVVVRHGDFSFVDYQDEHGHSMVDLSNTWLLKPLTRNTTWFLASLIITKYDFNAKYLILWAHRKGLWNPQVAWISMNFFVEVGVIQIGSFSKQLECDRNYQLPLTRSFFPTNFHSNLNTI